MRTTKMRMPFNMMTFVKFRILFFFFLSIRDNASAWWSQPPAEMILDVQDCAKGQEMSENST